MILRPYQVEAHHALDEAMIERQERSTIMALPTGSGKTLTAASWLHNRFLRNGCRILWFVHREELLSQAREAFLLIDPSTHVTEWSVNQKDDGGQVVIAMIMSSRALTRPFDVVVIDEAHHTAMPTYQVKLAQIPRDFTLGLTATPTRLDRKDLGFDSIAIQKSVLDLVAEGHLAKPVYVRVRTGQKYRMRVNHGAGDFDQRSLRQLDSKTRNFIVRKVWEAEPERWGKTLVFCCDIEHAEHLAAELSSAHRGSVGIVHGRLSSAERRERVTAFRSGQLQVMLNVGVFTEGFDVPDIRTIFLARPTASEVLYLQMVGRGTRVTPEKDFFHVVDFVDELGKYSLLTNRWAVEHLGAADEVAADVAHQQRENAERVMRDHKLPERQIREVLREFVNFSGLIEFQSAFDPVPIVMALTEEAHAAWLKLNLMLTGHANHVKETVNSSFAVTGAMAAEVPFRIWKNLAWATFFEISKRNEKGWVRFFPFRETTFDQEQIKKELADAQSESSKLNSELNNGKGKELLNEINVLMDNLGFMDFASGLKYMDQVLNVYTLYARDSIKPSGRGLIRRAIADCASDQLGVEVALQVFWGEAAP